MLSDGYHDVAPGKVAAVVTHLDMTRPDSLPATPDLPLHRVMDPEVTWYRDLFTRVGALHWLWVSRLAMAEETLAKIIGDKKVEVFALTLDGEDHGLLELDYRSPGSCELAFLGLTRQAQGRGFGTKLIETAIAMAFARDNVTKLHLHTCTFDSPWALPFYMRCGFVPVARQVQILDDPRLSGDVPADAAPQIPVI